MVNVNSHIQPQFFLSGFATAKEEEDHDDSVYVYRKGLPFNAEGPRKGKNPHKSGIDNTAFARNFYSFLTDDGTLDTQTYETRLEREIEAPGNKVLRVLRSISLEKGEVLRIQNVLNDSDRKAFARYVIGMSTRSKKGREQFDAAVEKIAHDASRTGMPYKEIAANIPSVEKEKLDRYIASENPDFDKSSGNLALPPNYLANFKNRLKKDESFPQSIIRGVDLLEPVLLQMKWQIRVSPTAHSFFSGDTSVFWNDLKEFRATLLFPFSSTAVFCAFNNSTVSEEIFTEQNYPFVVAVRDIIARQCKELYYSTSARWLVDFFNRR